MSEELRVPVQRVQVELVLGDGQRRRGTVFVPPGTDIEEVLDRHGAFLPVEEEGKVRLYAPGALACVSVVAAPRADDDSLPMARRSVSVRLRSGERLAGDVLYVECGGRQRTADLLNQPTATLALHAAAGVVQYVAKAHVESVEEA